MLEKLKNGYKNRALGYYFNATVTALSLVVAVVYAISYAGTAYISWFAFVLLLVIVLTNCVLLFLGKNEWSPLTTIVLATIAVCLFAYGIYFYVSIVMVGIDLQTFDSTFIINTILFVVLLGLSVANLFLRQSK